MEFESYSSFWNQQAATPEAALAAVDGSASEDIVRRTGRWTAAQVRAALGVDGSQRVLELGCGVGRIGRELARHCRSWHGVDISAAMVEVASSRLAGLENVTVSALTRTTLEPLADASFERAYTVAVLCHMDKEDLYLYLREIHRVLADGGLAYLETWNLAHPMGWKRWRFEVDNWDRADQTRRKDVGRNQFCSPEEFGLYVSGAGLEPLARFIESPWIQVVAGKNLSEKDRRRERARLTEEKARIAYSPLWGELFGELLEVIYGVRPPGEMLAALAEREPNDETELFRAYLLALWRQGEAQWGEPPSVKAP